MLDCIKIEATVLQHIKVETTVSHCLKVEAAVLCMETEVAIPHYIVVDSNLLT